MDHPGHTDLLLIGNLILNSQCKYSLMQFHCPSQIRAKCFILKSISFSQHICFLLRETFFAPCNYYSCSARSQKWIIIAVLCCAHYTIMAMINDRRSSQFCHKLLPHLLMPVSTNRRPYFFHHPGLLSQRSACLAPVKCLNNNSFDETINNPFLSPNHTVQNHLCFCDLRRVSTVSKAPRTFWALFGRDSLPLR